MNREFITRVALPILAATALMLGLTGYSLFWATAHSTRDAVTRQIRMVGRQVERSRAALAQQLEAVAVRDDALARSAPGQGEPRWLDEDTGPWLHRMFGIDQVYIVDPADRAVYAMLDGTSVGPDHYAGVADQLAALVRAARGARSASAAGGLRDGTGRAIHATAIAQVAERPAIVSVMHIVGSNDREPVRPSGQEMLLVGVRFLDTGLLKELRNEDQLQDARLSARPDAAPGEAALPLAGIDGTPSAYLIWRPEAPGHGVLDRLFPVFILMAAGILAAKLLLVRRLWRSQSELEASEAHAHHLAFQDELTGCANRVHLMERLEQLLVSTRRREQPGFALLLLDVDRFRLVNDQHGYQAGDELLQHLAIRLRGMLGTADVLARSGGNEFAIIQRDIAGPADPDELCRRLLVRCQAPFLLMGGQSVGITVSIGFALAPDAGIDRNGLLRRADIALSQAKAAGRNRACPFTESMDEMVRRRGELEADLRAMLKNGGQALRVHYQPQMSPDGRTLTGLEALVRWEHPRLGLLHPMAFIPVAEECGLAARIDDCVLEHVCRSMPRLPDVPVAVNLSPGRFYGADVADRLVSIAQRHGVRPSRLELEVTETVLLDDNEVSQTCLRRLRAAGFRIALDDFGTGYSSLSYLRRFQVDKIKIDQSFVKPLGRCAQAATLVRAIVNLGHALGLTVTAEGVETADQCEILAHYGCDQLQGFLFSRPEPEATIVTRFGLAVLGGDS